MWPEEGKDGASRAPCAAFVSQPSAAAFEARALAVGEQNPVGRSMMERELLDAIGVPLRPGQRVVYATAGMHATGQLVPGTIVSVRQVKDCDEPRERIGIR